jgi:hypothetical protein
MFLFQNANCSSGSEDDFIRGGTRFLRKTRKTKNKINYFVFIIIIDPWVQAGVWISK